MRLLDLFCGGGGAAMGYHRAGFTEIVGVDIKAQPRYPFAFVQGDALEYVAAHGREFDAIHASPPCQAFTTARVIHGVGGHRDLLTPTRAALLNTDRPWVIENVPGAPMRPDVVLCGSYFGARELKRHRWFEFSEAPGALVPPCDHDDDNIVSVFGHGGHIYHGVEDWRRVMGIDWMMRDELAQAIPPAYTEWIGRQLLAHLGVRGDAAPSGPPSPPTIAGGAPLGAPPGGPARGAATPEGSSS